MASVPTKRALVVDDDGLYVEQFSKILRKLGYNVDEAKDGMAALELCRATRYDLAMVDVRMPRLNGISFVQNVNRMAPGAIGRLVFVTSLDDATLRQNAMDAGAVAFLIKPVSAEAVVAAVTGERRQAPGDASAQNASQLDAVHESFARQGIMQTLGATLTRVASGECEIALPFTPALSQQHGFFHAGVVSTIADSAAGYAAYSMFPAGSSVLTVEFKINLLAPADGEKIRATGRVIKRGRTLTICEMQAFITKGKEEKLCAHGMSTLMCLTGSGSVRAG
jgi:uncharacterized protein (TIGR00369 family)